MQDVENFNKTVFVFLYKVGYFFLQKLEFERGRWVNFILSVLLDCFLQSIFFFLKVKFLG